MQLKELASLFPVSRLSGDGSTEITGVETDSRKVKTGDLFICLPGHVSDGHDYAQAAVQKGAAAIIAERETGAGVPTLYVKDSRVAMAVAANHFYGYPSKELKVIGVTGTNGKTTTTYIIEKILQDQGHQTGLMGTIQMKIGSEVFPVENTTQESLAIQQSFRKMKEAGAEYCIMEVSSHALDLGRVKGIRYRSALFTNLTQDHLDYHNTMEEYRSAKGLFFSRLGNEYDGDPDNRQYVVLNADDEASDYFAHLTSAPVITYGIEKEADVRASDISVTVRGTEFKLTTFRGEKTVKLKLIGKFNVYNSLGAIAATLLEGVPLVDIKNSLEGMAIVEGRMEPVDEGQEFLAIVDYAHSPDGLENALTTIREFAEGKVITVFGCGGDRDKTKRPKMGKIAGHYSDFVFATSDNPRSEDPEAILEDIRPGLLEAGLTDDRFELIADRRTAISKAVEKAGPKDVILIAGKGHETYQIIAGISHHFDDREEARNAIRGIRRD